MKLNPKFLTTSQRVSRLRTLFRPHTIRFFDQIRLAEHLSHQRQSARCDQPFIAYNILTSTAAKAGSTAFQALLSLFQGQFVLETK